MPTYLPPRGGVSLSEAYAEACAIAPVTRVLLDTLSFAHASIGTGTELRFVCDHQDLEATLEAGAPIQPSTAVTFTRCGFSVQLPGEADQPQDELRIALTGVSQVAAQALAAAARTTSPVVVRHRIYASDDTSAPAVLPVLTMEVTSAEITDVSVVLTARYRDPANTAFPRITYTREQYPSLST